jgi:hypothetical protein
VSNNKLLQTSSSTATCTCKQDLTQIIVQQLMKLVIKSGVNINTDNTTHAKIGRGTDWGRRIERREQ